MPHKEILTKNVIKILCIPESFNTNISDHFFLQNNLSEFTTREHEF